MTHTHLNNTVTWDVTSEDMVPVTDLFFYLLQMVEEEW